MNKNELKKTLYKEKPQAILLYIKGKAVWYEAKVGEISVLFSVPLDDVGDAEFLPIMQAQLLIRYLNYEEETKEKTDSELPSKKV